MMKMEFRSIVLAAALVLSGCVSQQKAASVQEPVDDLPPLPSAEELGITISKGLSIETLDSDGWANNRPGSYKKAVVYFSEAIFRDPRNADLFMGRSYAYKKLGYWAKNHADLAEAIRLDPGHPRALNALGWNLATHLDPRYRDADRAIAISKRAVRQRPTASHVVSTLAAAYAEAGNFEMATEVQMQAIDLEKAETDNIAYLVELERDLQLFKSGVPVRDHQTMTTLQIGRNAAIFGDYDLALVKLGEAVEIMPDNQIVYGELGRAYMGMKRWDDAARSFRKDLELDQLDQESYWSLAWILATHPEEEKRDGQQALILAKEAVRLSSRATSYDALAAAQAEIGDFSAAVISQKKALAKSSGKDRRLRRERLEAYQAKKAWISN